MGPIPSDDSKELDFLDADTTSYTPILSAFIESRMPKSLSETFDKSSLRLAAQPDTLALGVSEIRAIQAAVAESRPFFQHWRRQGPW